MIAMVPLENLDYKDLSLNSCREFVWKNKGINSSKNIVMAYTIMVDYIVMKTSISPFSNPLCDLPSTPKFSILT
jgi:hypothetical protein